MSNEKMTAELAAAARENTELKQRIAEQEYQISAMGDVHRLNLMAHLLPYYLGLFPDSEAIQQAVDVADQCVSKLEVEMNAKAAKLLKKLESVDDVLDDIEEGMSEN